MTGSPFEDETFAAGPGKAAARGVAVLKVAGAAAGLSTLQTRFNQLIDKLKGQRDDLQRWQAYRQFYRQQFDGKYQPMIERLREQRIAMAELLDRALEGNELGKRERDKAHYLLNQLIAMLLDDGEEPAIIRLHDKYSAVSFRELQQERMAQLRSAAEKALDIDLEAYSGGAESPAEFTAWIEAQLHATLLQDAKSGAGQPGAGQPQGPRRRRSAKAAQRETLREQAAEGASRAVREAYRKLVSELHPDREADPAEQARKTGLMQRVNQAYKAGDLLALLELQLSLEQIDAAALAGLADERLRHYVHVLEEQSRRLRDELKELIEPFAELLGAASARRMTIDAVQRSLERDMRELKTVLRKLEMDVICFRNVRQLKQSLGSYHVEPLDDDELDMPDDFVTPARAEPRHRRSRGRR